MASKDLASLDRRLTHIASRMVDGVQVLMAEVCEEIGKRVVNDTPVETGFAKANWRPSLNAPSSTPVSFLDPTGAATISNINTVARRWRIGDTFFLVNRAPYIENLNDGSSPQAPARYVQKAVERGLKHATVRRRGRLI